MTAESLNFWLTKFVEQVCKEDGERYPHWNAEFTVCGSGLYIFCNGWNCDENDKSCFIKRHPY